MGSSAWPAIGPRVARAQAEDLHLELQRPPDGATVFATPVLVAGRTNPGRTVLVITEDDAWVAASTDAEGAFSATVDLVPGLNNLIVLSLVAGDLAAPILDLDLAVGYYPDDLESLTAQ